MSKRQIAQPRSQPPLNIRQDSRGKLIEICKGNFAQCNILKMRKDSVWGKHYHKKTTEYFYILQGKISVSVKNMKRRAFHDGESKLQTKQVFKKGDLFVIQPYTLHTMHVLEPTMCIVLYSQQFSENNPDLYHL